jgi:hypothetical protein
MLTGLASLPIVLRCRMKKRKLHRHELFLATRRKRWDKLEFGCSRSDDIELPFASLETPFGVRGRDPDPDATSTYEPPWENRAKRLFCPWCASTSDRTKLAPHTHPVFQYMSKSKSFSTAFKSFPSPLVAPGSPSVALRTGRATPTTSTRPPTQDLVLNNLATASRITKDVAEALNKVPYIKAVTGVLAQIIKIHEVWKPIF